MVGEYRQKQGNPLGCPWGLKMMGACKDDGHRVVEWRQEI